MQSNKNFYEGQNIYIGLDVHANQWHVYAAPKDTIKGRAVCMPPTAEALKTYLQNNFPGGIYYSGYETGFCGFNSHRELVKAGIHNIVFNAGDLKRSNKEIVRKTDALDCKSIWQNLSKGELEAIYVPTIEEESARELVRGRECFNKDVVRLKQRIKMFLHKTGIKAPDELSAAQSHWSKAYMEWLRVTASSLEGGTSLRLQTLVDTLVSTKANMDMMEKEMYKACKNTQPEIFILLQTVPGIGILSAAKICLEIMNFDRFPDERHLAGYIGLVPDCHISDKKEVIIGTSTRRNKILRNTLIECAWMSLSKDPALGGYYSKGVAKGKKPNVVIVSVAKKLVNRIYYVHRTRKAYKIGEN